MKMQIHILTAARLDLLQRCCKSVAAALIPESFVTVLVNGDHPESVAWLKSFNHPAFSFSQIPAESLIAARNRPFDEKKADLLYYLDDDVEVPPHLFRIVYDYFQEHPEVGIVGGPNLTPPWSRWREKAFGAVMTSLFTAPMVRARYGAGPRLPENRQTSELELANCNLGVRQSVIPANIRLRSDLRANEENLFIFQCKTVGIKAAFLRQAYVYHYRRRSLRAFARQIFASGCGRAHQTRAEPRSLHVAFLAPAAACLAFFVFLFVPTLRGYLPWITGGYLLAATIGSLESSIVRGLGPGGVLLMGPLTAVVHASYGLGFWWGLFTKKRIL